MDECPGTPIDDLLNDPVLPSPSHGAGAYGVLPDFQTDVFSKKGKPETDPEADEDGPEAEASMAAYMVEVDAYGDTVLANFDKRFAEMQALKAKAPPSKAKPKPSKKRKQPEPEPTVGIEQERLNAYNCSRARSDRYKGKGKTVETPTNDFLPPGIMRGTPRLIKSCKNKNCDRCGCKCGAFAEF